MSYIYKITNIQNDKMYIGKTILSIEKRFQQHILDSRKERKENRPLYRAFNKYGIESFILECIEEITEDLSSEREQYWIKYFDTYHNGYNATLGGEGKICADYDLILSLWQEGKGIKEIYQITGYASDTIRTALDNFHITLEERMNRGVDSHKKKVAQIDLKTNEIISIYNSLTDAAQSINKPKTHLSAVCLNKRKTAYGFKWQYI